MVHSFRSAIVALLVFSILSLAAVSAQAFDGMVAMNHHTLHENAHKSKITLRDAVAHEPRVIDFRDKTLGTIRAGDHVLVDGKDHIVTEISKYAPERTVETSGSVLAGLGFTIAAILKFKAHRDTGGGGE